MQFSFFRSSLLFLFSILATEAHAGDAGITLMSYNVWKQWSQVDDGFRKGIASIKASGADIVGLQEASLELAVQISAELGWHRTTKGSDGVQILSRLPIMESLSMDRLVGARILISEQPAREILVFNCHLDYRFYGPYAAMKAGATPASVLEEENRSNRAPQMKRMLEFMKQALDGADAAPVFLTGDFNGPSHLDWTETTAAQHGNIGAVAWSPSIQIIATGMIDSFRAAYPDPAKDPGFTWSTIHKGNEPQDRIDFIYHKGNGVTVQNSRIFTTAVEATTGPWSADHIATIKGNTWPSDHAAVVTRYLLK